MLFDLEHDPAEQRNLAEGEPTRTRQMRELLDILKSRPSQSVFGGLHDGQDQTVIHPAGPNELQTVGEAPVL
jgi:hypothetical protein